MSWPTSGMVAPDFSHSTLRSSSGDGGSGSSSFFTQAGGPCAFRRLSQGRLLGVCCFSGCWSVGSGWVGAHSERHRADGAWRRGGRPSGRDRAGRCRRQGDPSTEWGAWEQSLSGPHKGSDPHHGVKGVEGQPEAPARSAHLAWLLPSAGGGDLLRLAQDRVSPACCLPFQPALGQTRPPALSLQGLAWAGPRQSWAKFE